MRDSRRWAVLALFLLLISCSPTVGGGKAESTVVFLAAGQSALNASGEYDSELIYDQVQLEKLWKGLGNKFMADPERSVPDVDFSSEWALFLSMGQKSTAGYGLELDAQELTLSKHMGIVRVLWQEPQPGSMQAQMLTAPYLLVRLPHLDISEIRVLDQGNRVREVLMLDR